MLARAFVVLWWTLGLVIFYLSVHTLVQGTNSSPRDLHAIIIGGLEAVAALLFIVPRTTRIGAMGLLAIIALAFAVHVLSGEFRAPFLVYAAGVLFVLVHGPVRVASLRNT
jgi:uncharacterized membrane protein YphA (DoxX/SURF4 family)